jgi:pyruvate,water dikinase
MLIILMNEFSINLRNWKVFQMVSQTENQRNHTDIGWSLYFPMLSGLATEIGGLISHGVVIAREQGLPCLVGVEGASKLFRSRDIILND